MLTSENIKFIFTLGIIVSLILQRSLQGNLIVSDLFIDAQKLKLQDDRYAANHLAFSRQLVGPREVMGVIWRSICVETGWLRYVCTIGGIARGEAIYDHLHTTITVLLTLAKPSTHIVKRV